MKFQDLEKDLKQNKLAPAYLFTGPERYLVNSYIDRIKQKVVNPATETLNFLRLSSKDRSMKEVVALSETVPMMSDKRVVVIDQDVGILKTKNQEEIDTLISYLKDPVSTTVLIIVDEKPDKRLGAYRKIKKNVREIEFKKLSLAEIRKWVQKLFRSEKVKISNADVAYLLDRLHYTDRETASLFSVKNECENLISFVGEEGEITRSLIDQIVPESLEDNIFKIIDYIVNGKLQGIYRILNAFWEQGESPFALLGLLIYQLRNMLKIKILQEKGYTQNQILEATGLSRFVFNKITPIARHFSLNRLYELFIEAAQVDLNMKSGAVNPEFAFEMFLLKLNKRK